MLLNRNKYSYSLKIFQHNTGEEIFEIAPVESMFSDRKRERKERRKKNLFQTPLLVNREKRGKF